MRKGEIPKIYGLLGYPVRHSLSPAMHAAAFKKLKLNGIYLLFEARRENFTATLKKLKLMGVSGFNVTVPYKEEIVPHLDKLDESAARVGAVNTVLNKGGKLTGYNTDGRGFIRSLRSDLGFRVKGKNIFIVGAGGAARAIGFSLAQEKARTVTFYDVIPERAAKLAGDIGKTFPSVRVSSVDSCVCSYSFADLIVNASSCGMKMSDPLPVDPKLLSRKALVYDIIYSPAPTKFIRSARAAGIKGVNGEGMLLGQGALAFRIWTGRNAPQDVMRRALRIDRRT